MNYKTIERTVLAYNMGAYRFPDVDKYSLAGYDEVDFYVVNSKFDQLFRKTEVSANHWADLFKNLYNEYKSNPDRFSRYIIVATSSNDILYCKKIK